MKGIPVSDVRNFAFLGHTGSGKTTLVDAILHKVGIADRAGSTADGTSFSDWTDEEKERKISVYAKPFDAVVTTTAGTKFEVVMLDTPGYLDFYGQVVAAASVADAALVTVDAAAGVQVGTNRSWRLGVQRELPRGIVITAIDKDNADFESTLVSIQDVWGNRCLPVTLPAPDRKSVVDVLTGENVPEAMKAAIDAAKTALVEAAVETNDALMEKYLGGETLPPAEIAAGLRRAVLNGTLYPVFATAGTQEVGLDALLEGLFRLFPSPIDRPAKDADGNPVAPEASAPFVGQVWRSITDPYVGQLTLVRVYGGTLKADSEVFNSTREQKERIGSLLMVNGKKQETITDAEAGDIVALAKLKHTQLNDSLCASGKTVSMPPIRFPKPVTAYAITAKNQGDEDKLANGLHRVADEDPTLKVERNSETHEMIISGMGDIHLDIAVDRMKKRNNVEVVLSIPKVAYKETVTSTGEGHYKHKKQSGGRGQYGEVYLRVEKKSPADEDWFVNKIVGGAIPGNFIPAVQKGLVEGMTKGSVAGYPVIDAKVVIYDGSYHDVDSSEIAFKIAGARAFKDGMSKAHPVLLEPIMKVTIMVPEQFMGDVTGDLNHKRGRILGMGSEDGMQVLTAEAPMAELFKYSSELRSITGGRGTFELEFSRYDVVPSNIAQKIVAASAKEKEEDD